MFFGKGCSGLQWNSFQFLANKMSVQTETSQTRMPIQRRAKHRRFRQVMDRLAGVVVWVGGIATILSIMGIFAYLVWEIIPLFQSTTGTETAQFQVVKSHIKPSKVSMVGIDEYQEVAFVLRGKQLQFYSNPGGELLSEPSRDLPIQKEIQSAVFIGQKGHRISVATKNGRVIPLTINFRSVFKGKERTIVPHWKIDEGFLVIPEGEELLLHAHTQQDDQQIIATVTQSGSVWLTSVKEPDEFSFSEEVTVTRRQLPSPEDVIFTHLVLDSFGQRLVGGTEHGELVVWSLRDSQSGIVRMPVGQSGEGITALTYLLGERTLVVGTEKGQVSTWAPEEGEKDSGKPPFRKITEFQSHRGSVQGISFSPRDKGFVSSDSQGEIYLHFGTTGKTILTFEASSVETEALRFAPKADGVVWLGQDGKVRTFKIDNPHPEITLQALFSPMMYEGYKQPELIWQSSSGSDDFEPKFGLIPLIFGTFKGTLYAMILAVPLAVMGAVYTSMFMHPHLRAIVKPTVEIMAALPSVVLGFLAGLWFAPLLEEIFPSILASVILLPIMVGIVCLCWQVLPRTIKHFETFGLDLFVMTVVVGGTVALCLGFNSSIETLVFDGDYKHWLHERLGLVYDQRNAIVIGFAMGFAVIPIIFSIAEDSLSNVPRHLVAGSLALGATQWQTLTRLVLISASPGIFSALMIGLGRAIGETMIVLMATGNTPIMDWSVFNGFRTLSANIAVEMPEAPHGGTLYRILFLSGLLLFAFTFCINTVAEVIRQRLRDKYSQF